MDGEMDKATILCESLTLTSGHLFFAKTYRKQISVLADMKMHLHLEQSNEDECMQASQLHASSFCSLC